MLSELRVDPVTEGLVVGVQQIGYRVLPGELLLDSLASEASHLLPALRCVEQLVIGMLLGEVVEVGRDETRVPSEAVVGEGIDSSSALGTGRGIVGLV
jgi:hypothetical protein